jgi:hypothetical protein
MLWSEVSGLRLYASIFYFLIFFDKLGVQYIESFTYRKQKVSRFFFVTIYLCVHISWRRYIHTMLYSFYGNIPYPFDIFLRNLEL